MNRKRFLLVYGVSAESWAQRHDLEQYTRPCSQCGAMLTTSIPFASGTLRGFTAPACTCGNENTPYVVVRQAGHGDLFDVQSARARQSPRSGPARGIGLRVLATDD